ncbi:hypothetical protein MLD38_007108 [Melastoma candidum]|uniref:Uncharacterized protein n=1 Tax=Melastoma candidum TaxID=119954 RepID=A0ACB9RUA9_9MYRT|nr:hypothetical protein MLD38_007108 [Melastoma candidum]
MKVRKRQKKMPPSEMGSTTTSTSFGSLSSFLRRHLLCGSSWKPPPGCRRSHPALIPCEFPPPPPPVSSTPHKSDKLLHLLDLADIHERQEIEEETRRKVDSLDSLKEVVSYLQCHYDGANGDYHDDGRRKKEGAIRVRLLSKEDGEARSMLAMLGAIPPLVGMIDCDDDEATINALYALLNLGIANEANKAAIVKAGAVHKMLKVIESSSSDDNVATNPLISEAIVANFLGLSASDSNKPIIGSSGAIPFLVNTLMDLDRKSSSQAKQDSLRALYNLSIFHPNIGLIIETDLIPFLIASLGDMDVSDRSLSILSNVVSMGEGRKAISAVPDAFTVLVDVLSWTDSPVCQEKASYILMVMAHKAYGDRQAMIDAGIVSALLELTLLGSALAQKRASRVLECLRVDKGKQISESYSGGGFAAVSGPMYSSPTSTSAIGHGDAKECLEEEAMMSEEKKAVKQLVQQSLQNNMKRIVKRANLPQDFVPSDHLKSLTASSTSKSLPF